MVNDSSFTPCSIMLAAMLGGSPNVGDLAGELFTEDRADDGRINPCRGIEKAFVNGRLGGVTEARGLEMTCDRPRCDGNSEAAIFPLMIPGGSLDGLAIASTGRGMEACGKGSTHSEGVIKFR